MTLVICRGLPHAGKSSYAGEWVAEDPGNRARVNRGDMRAMMFPGLPRSFDDRVVEEAVTRGVQGALHSLLCAGRDVITDDTNLNPNGVKRLLGIARKLDVTVEFRDFPITVEDSKRRDQARGDILGPDVIDRLAQNMLPDGTLPPHPVLMPPRPRPEVAV